MQNDEKNFLQSGAHDPEKDIRSLKIAKDLYEQYSKRNKFIDCAKIANRTNFSIEQIMIVRDYIFENCHWRRDGRFRTFDPDYAMAESWGRLIEKNFAHIEPHDVLMLQHELYEITILLQNPDYSVTTAHEIAEQEYNYSKASREYYAKIFSKKKKTSNTDASSLDAKPVNAFLGNNQKK